MDVIAHEAVAELATLIESLLPPTEAGLEPSVTVVPRTIAPSGLGGYVGSSREPFGDVLGRVVSGQVLVRVRADDVPGLGVAVQEVTTSLLGAGPEELRGQGVMKIELSELGPALVTGQGGNQVATREVEFTVLFEHLRLPEEAGDVIEAVPTFTEVGSTAEAGGRLFQGRFGPGSLSAFEVFDDPGATQGGPSEWTYQAEERRIAQLANIRGGSFEITPNKPGTYLVLRSTPGTPPVRDFVLSTELGSDDIDGLGLVFRWTDVDNFYFLLLDARREYRMMGRKVAGVFEALEPEAVSEEAGFVPGQIHSVRLRVQDATFELYIDSEPALTATDSAFDEAGRIGFFCRANDSAHFYRLDLIQL